MHSVVSKICVNWIFVIFSPSFTTISDGASQRLYEDADDRLPRWTPLIWPTKQTWARYTVRPKYQQDDFKFKGYPVDSSFQMALIIPFVVIIILILLCKCLVCKANGCFETSMYTIEPTLHAPPPRSNVHMPPTTNWSRSETDSNSLHFHTPSLTHMGEELFRSTPNVTAPSAPNLTYAIEENSSRRNGRVENNAPRASDGASTPYDKPPDYSAVVIGGSSQIFPPVQPNQNLDMPPPKYSETDLMKF